MNLLSSAGSFGAGFSFPLYLYPNNSKNNNSLSKSEKIKTKLQHKLEQAEEHFAKVSRFFHETIEPFFNQLENPDEANISLFEENNSLYEEAQTAVEHLKNQIKSIDNEPLELFEIEDTQIRKPNLNMEIVQQIEEKLNITFVPEKYKDTCELTKEATFAPIDILDYIYAVLHSPTYRDKYKEFLKIDFPRVPYPKNSETFWQLVKLGGEIRQIHLLESPKVEEYITGYPIDGDNSITTKIAKKDWEITGKISNLQGFENLEGLAKGRIWISETQYFENIPLVAWEFYIGGYQPAQKWLKDRKGRTLNFDDILHYQKIIVALTETDRIMKEIDKINIE